MLALDLIKAKRFWSCPECRDNGLQRERGCREVDEGNPYEILEINGEEHRCCPVDLISTETMLLIEDAMMVKSLRMPLEAGGIDDQQNKEAQALSLIFSVLAPDDAGDD